MLRGFFAAKRAALWPPNSYILAQKISAVNTFSGVHLFFYHVHESDFFFSYTLLIVFKIPLWYYLVTNREVIPMQRE